jgi:hypothetical protein
MLSGIPEKDARTFFGFKPLNGGHNHKVLQGHVSMSTLVGGKKPPINAGAWGATPKFDGHCILMWKDSYETRAVYNQSGTDVADVVMPELRLPTAVTGLVLQCELMGMRSMKDRTDPFVIIHDVWMEDTTYLERVGFLTSIFRTYDMYWKRKGRIYVAPNISLEVDEHWSSMKDYNSLLGCPFYEGFVFKRWDSLMSFDWKDSRERAKKPPKHTSWLKVKYPDEML